ncbi:MAG: hypothetical protein J3K34DRAFT_433538 [Monoraphidium minutum]|nr:MAG: hypothetical protein J3K34DRAFT_433538 [Monoraphidium minutum]
MHSYLFRLCAALVRHLVPSNGGHASPNPCAAPWCRSHAAPCAACADLHPSVINPLTPTLSQRNLDGCVDT